MRRFRLRNIASLFFATLRRFSSQHCVAFFRNITLLSRKSHTSHINSSVRSLCKNLIHLILIARCKVFAKISYISTSHINSLMQIFCKNFIHLILIARLCHENFRFSLVSFEISFFLNLSERKKKNEIFRSIN